MTSFFRLVSLTKCSTKIIFALISETKDLAAGTNDLMKLANPLNSGFKRFADESKRFVAETKPLVRQTKGFVALVKILAGSASRLTNLALCLVSESKCLAKVINRPGERPENNVNSNDDGANRPLRSRLGAKNDLNFEDQRPRDPA